jgi:hypothetical protein
MHSADVEIEKSDERGFLYDHRTLECQTWPVR